MPQTEELPTTQDPMEASVCGHWGECDLGCGQHNHCISLKGLLYGSEGREKKLF